MADATARVDVAVIGGGPAGVAAACRAAESGARIMLIDEAAEVGGQIFRRHAGSAPSPRARPWLERFARSGAVHMASSTVFDLERTVDGWTVYVDDAQSGRRYVAAARVVLATGARERFLPFPGWTLPGVMGAGGAQALLKSGMDVRGRRIVVAGTGPLLLPVASSLVRSGARVELVAEQAGILDLVEFGLRLASRPAKLLEAVRYRDGAHRYPDRHMGDGCVGR